MRISDWSSDVCSSDLESAAVLEVHRDRWDRTDSIARAARIPSAPRAMEPCAGAQPMQQIDFDTGVQVALDSLLAERLALLAGAGLSMAPPSSLPSAATIAAEATRKFDALHGQGRARLAPGIGIGTEAVRGRVCQ